MPRVTASVACALVTTAALARAQTTQQLAKELEGVEVVERLGATVPRDTELTDEDGHRVTLASYAGRPIALTLNYTSCPMLCNLQLAGLAEAVKSLSARPGRDFELVTLSIDPDETPTRLRGAKLVHVREAGGEVDVTAGWHFVAGTAESIAAVANAVGFHYRRDPSTGEFRHKATLIFITPDGRVSSYLHGVGYAPADLETAIRRAARGEVLTPQAQAGLVGFLMSCFTYDPKDKTPLALFVMRTGGLVALAFLVGVLGVYGARDFRRRRVHRRPIAEATKP